MVLRGKPSGYQAQKNEKNGFVGHTLALWAPSRSDQKPFRRGS